MYPLNEFGIIEIEGNIYIDVESFESMFGKKEEHNFKYNYLYNHERATPAWKVIFESWKDQGILN